MNQRQITGTFPTISPGNLDEFKRLAGEAMQITRGEAGTLQYDWFWSDDQSSAVVRETYQGSDAVLAHMGNHGDLLGSLIELGGGLNLEVFGEPSEALLEAGAALEPTVYSFFQGK